MHTLEDILIALGAQTPFLEKAEETEDGAIQPFTPEGAKAYNVLIDILFCIGNITGAGIYMDYVVEALDKVADLKE